MSLFSVMLASVVVLLTVAAYILKALPSFRRWTISGPKGLPFIGNLHQVFGSKPFFTFANWAKIYGDIFYLRLGHRNVIVINSIEAAREALVKNGKSFSGRPDFYTMSLLHEQERRFVFCEGHDEILKLYRKTVLMDMRKRLQSLGATVKDEIDKMALDIFSTDSVEQVLDMREHIQKLAANVAHGYAFGRTYELNDPKLKCWMSALAEYRELLHWFRYENFLPFNQLLASEFQTKAKQFREQTLPLYDENIQRAKRSKSECPDGDDNGLLGILLDLLAGDDVADKLTENDIISVLRDVMFGGSDGAFQPLIWILMYVAKDEKIQKRIESEILAVIGPSRMPELSDREQMPCVEATIREVLRHSEITSLGIPRSTVEDVTIFGHRIPKHTLTIINVYSIHRDDRHWQDPYVFQPSRFLDDNNELLPVSKLSYLPFSAGQRSCVGQNIARANIFLLFVRFFQKFRIFPADEEIPEKINSGGSFNPELKPFKIKLKLREL